MLIATSIDELQKLLDIVFAYCQKWRFLFNIEKSNVVVFSTKRKLQVKAVTLGHDQLKIVQVYKYLGVEFDNKLRWHEVKERLIAKARHRIPLVTELA